MKIKKFTPQVLTTLLVLFAFQLSAQTTNTSSGLVADDVLLAALVGVIALLIVVNLVLMGTIKSVSTDKNIWAIIKEKNANSKAGAALLFIALTLSNLNSFAGSEEAASKPFIMGSDLFYALLAMVAMLLFLLMYQIKVLRNLMGLMRSESEEAEEESDAWVAALTDVVPIEREEEIMFEHEHDGIRELDNNLPPWWLWGFYATIAFALWYIPYYNIFDGPLQIEEYNTKMAEAEEAKAAYMAGLSNLIDESNVEAMMDESTLATGKEIYTTNCVACHGNLGQGGVGPNFSDKNWLHGGGIKNIFKTIKYGVPTKGMISWEDQMSPGQMQAVASYIMTFEGTNPPNPKEPQGEIWTEDASAAETQPVESNTEPDKEENTEE